MPWQLVNCLSGVRRWRRETRHLLHCNSAIARPARDRRELKQLSAQCMRASCLLDDIMTCFKLCAAPHMTQEKRDCENTLHNDGATWGQEGSCDLFLLLLRLENTALEALHDNVIGHLCLYRKICLYSCGECVFRNANVWQMCKRLRHVCGGGARARTCVGAAVWGSFSKIELQ